MDLGVLLFTLAAAAGLPTGADLLFMSNRDGNAEIFVRRAGSEEWVNLTNDPAVDNWPVWSPDGSKIAFQSKRGADKLDVWVMNADGSEPRRLTNHPDHDYLPSWSPDGKRIAFASWRTEAEGEERAAHLYVMNADGTGQRRLVAESTGTSGGLAWSPDGSRILFTRQVGERADLVIAASDGTGERKLTDDDAYDGSAEFSPDGRSIAFYSDDGTGADLVVMRVDGSGRRVLVADGNSWYPRWSRDGAWIVFTAPAPTSDPEDLDLSAVRADGSGKPVRILGSPKREAEGSWKP